MKGALLDALSLAAAIALLPMGGRAEERALLSFEDDDTLEEIRYKIDYNGFGFTVDHNWVFDMSPEEKARFFSRRPTDRPARRSASDAIGPVAHQIGAVSLPASFDWRNRGGHSYIGPIRDQDDCGSCYAFGACAAAEGAYNYAIGLTDASCIDFSESYIIWCLARIPAYGEHFYGCDGTDYDYIELTALRDTGVALESSFPYTITDPGSCTHWSAATTTFQGWYRLPCSDVDAIKTALLLYGVLDVAVDAGAAFQAYDGGIYSDIRTGCPESPCYYTSTNHAVALVGWVDNTDTPHWILRNSWGTTWGEAGYMRIAYHAARVACEATYLVYRRDQSYHTDFDGDGTSDPALFRAANGLWSVRGVTRAYLGTSTDQGVPGDYDGDGTTEIAVHRGQSGLWSIQGLTRLYFGALNDLVRPGDYNGDGRFELGLFRPSSGLWAVNDVTRVSFGESADLPAPGFYRGGHALDLAVFRRSTGMWAVRDVTRVYLGSSSDTPVAGDYDGDGTWEPAIYRPSTGLWSIRGVTVAYLGSGVDSPQPGDYDGDGTDDIAIYRGAEGLWSVRDLTRCYFGSSADNAVTR